MAVRSPRGSVSLAFGLGLAAMALFLAGCVGRAGAPGGGPVAAHAAGAGATATVAQVRADVEPAAGGSVVASAVAPDLVPSTLAGRPWLVRDRAGSVVAGVIGSRGRLRLPSSERPLAVGNGLVVTAADGSAGTDVLVRDMSTGRVMLTVTRPEQVLTAAIAPGAVVLAGHVPSEPDADPGLVALSLSDGSARSVIPAVAGVGGGPLVRTLSVSPSGRTLVSGLCGSDGCSLEVVDASTWSVHRLATGLHAYPGVLTDEVVVVGDADSSWIAGLDLGSGERRWSRGGAEFQHAYATASGGIVQALVDRRGEPTFRLEAIDPATGEGRVVLTRNASDGLALWPEISSDESAVIGAGTTFADAAVAGGRVRASVVDIASGRLDGDALSLDVGTAAP